MQHLATTYQKLAKYTEGEKLQIQAQEAQIKVSGGEYSHKIKTMPAAQDARRLKLLMQGAQSLKQKPQIQQRLF